MNPLVGIILVLYHSREHLKRLVPSLIRQTYKNFRIYVIENSDDLESIKLLTELNIPHGMVESQGNIGYARANNILAKKAINEGCDLLFVLNPDTELLENCISELVDAFNCKENVGLTSCVICYGDNGGRTDRIQSYGLEIQFKAAKKKIRFANKRVSETHLETYDEVKLFFGGAFMIRSSLVNQIGLFEEIYYMYNDELDLAYRVNKANYKCIMTSNTRVWHYHDFSTKNRQKNIIMYYYMMRNKYLYYFKFGFYSSMVIDLVKQAVMSPLTIRWLLKLGGYKLVKYYFLGIFNGIKQERGKTNLGIHK